MIPDRAWTVLWEPRQYLGSLNNTFKTHIVPNRAWTVPEEARQYLGHYTVPGRGRGCHHASKELLVGHVASDHVRHSVDGVREDVHWHP